MIRQLRRRLEGLEEQVSEACRVTEADLPNSKRLLRALDFLLERTANPGLERVHDYLRGTAAWLREYVTTGQVGAFVEYQCGCTLSIAGGPTPGMPGYRAEHPLVVAIKAMGGLHEKLRSCHQHDLCRTPEQVRPIGTEVP